LQQLQHLLHLLQRKTILSHPHFPAAGGGGPDLAASSTEVLDCPIIPAFEPPRIPTLEPAIDLLAKHLEQSSFLRQLANFWQQGHSRENRRPPLDGVVATDSSTLENVSATGNLQSRRVKYCIRDYTNASVEMDIVINWWTLFLSCSPFKIDCKLL
jgi:hypothetical protein